jgi:hypothetical protein
MLNILGVKKMPLNLTSIGNRLIRKMVLVRIAG